MRESEFSSLTGFTKECVGGWHPRMPPLAFRFLRQGLKTGWLGCGSLAYPLQWWDYRQQPVHPVLGVVRTELSHTCLSRRKV